MANRLYSAIRSQSNQGGGRGAHFQPGGQSPIAVSISTPNVKDVGPVAELHRQGKGQGHGNFAEAADYVCLEIAGV
jgi:hypothetical protein